MHLWRVMRAPVATKQRVLLEPVLRPPDWKGMDDSGCRELGHISAGSNGPRVPVCCPSPGPPKVLSEPRASLGQDFIPAAESLQLLRLQLLRPQT